MRIPDELYQVILRSMPIACVDLIVSNLSGEVLLLRRVNEPARGEWWFPGGRVHFGEKREAAARRHLLEECGLHAADVEELWTQEVILPLESNSHVSHGITTLYAVDVDTAAPVRLDSQTSEFAWKQPVCWHEETLHPTVRDIFANLETRFRRR